MSAVTSYLRGSAGMAEEQVKSLAEQGEGLLKQILPSLNLTAPAHAEKEGAVVDDAPKAEDGKEKKTVLIKDVRAWKASLPASKGPSMVRDLSEFEEVGAKL
jgi:insulysin